MLGRAWRPLRSAVIIDVPNLCARSVRLQADVTQENSGMIRRVLVRLGIAGVIAVSALDTGGTLQAQRRSPDGYISGAVRSSNGPEAGVWVIAETKDLPTNFIKIVVTDDAAASCCRNCRPRTTTCGFAATALSIQRRSQLKPGATDVHAAGDAREDSAGSRQGLSRQLLAVAPRAAGEERVPRHRPRRQRHRPHDADAESLDQLAQVRLQLLPSARQRRSRATSSTSSRRSRSSRRTPKPGNGGSAWASAAPTCTACCRRRARTAR